MALHIDLEVYETAYAVSFNSMHRICHEIGRKRLIYAYLASEVVKSYLNAFLGTYIVKKDGGQIRRFQG